MGLYLSIFIGNPTSNVIFFFTVECSRRRWEENIRMDLGEIGINAENWVDSAQDRNYWRALVNATLNLQIP